MQLVLIGFRHYLTQTDRKPPIPVSVTVASPVFGSHLFTHPSADAVQTDFPVRGEKEGGAWGGGRSGDQSEYSLQQEETVEL